MFHLNLFLFVPFLDGASFCDKSMLSETKKGKMKKFPIWFCNTIIQFNFLPDFTSEKLETFVGWKMWS